MTSREQLLSRSQTKYVDVTLSDGLVVTLRSLHAGDEHDIELSLFDIKSGKRREGALSEVKFRRLAKSIVETETKDRAFSDDEWACVRDMSPKDVEKLYEAYMDLSGVDQKTSEELVGNSD